MFTHGTLAQETVGNLAYKKQVGSPTLSKLTCSRNEAEKKKVESNVPYAENP